MTERKVEMTGRVVGLKLRVVYVRRGEKSFALINYVINRAFNRL